MLSVHVQNITVRTNLRKSRTDTVRDKQNYEIHLGLLTKPRAEEKSKILSIDRIGQDKTGYKNTNTR